MKIGLNREKGTNGLYLRYCLANAGGLSAALILLRIAGALIPTVQILLLATFLNSVQQAFAIGQFTQSLVIGIVMLVGLQILDNLLSTGSAYLSIKHQIRVGTAFELEILEKRSL